jgi:hypothetical protein
MLQHDVAPVVWLVLSITPTGLRLHRVGSLDLGGEAKHRFVAVAKKPAYFVQTPADQQQGAGRRQVIFPTSHVSPPCPTESPVLPDGGV